jgi:hypothetical protein
VGPERDAHSERCPTHTQPACEELCIIAGRPEDALQNSDGTIEVENRMCWFCWVMGIVKLESYHECQQCSLAISSIIIFLLGIVRSPI